MAEWLMNLEWNAIIQIIIIDILLGGDNAVVIALACRNLPPRARRLGIIWGAGGAILLRVILITVAVAMKMVHAHPAEMTSIMDGTTPFPHPRSLCGPGPQNELMDP